MGEVLTYTSGKIANVRHIGYVFSRWREIEYFSVSESDIPFSNCRLEVYFTDRSRISLYFGSLAAVWDIICQPLFFGQTVYWFGRGYEIRQDAVLHF